MNELQTQAPKSDNSRKRRRVNMIHQSNNGIQDRNHGQPQATSLYRDITLRNQGRPSDIADLDTHARRRLHLIPPAPQYSRDPLADALAAKHKQKPDNKRQRSVQHKGVRLERQRHLVHQGLDIAEKHSSSGSE